MQNNEHLDILKQGRDNWNEWIKTSWKEQPTIKMYSEKPLRDTMVPHLPFMNADLGNINLSEFKDFTGFNFTKVNFSNSNLKGLNFTNCEFRKANFVNADLRGAIFTNCSFNETILIHSNLTQTSFRESKFYKANLSDSNLYKANFTNVTLSQCALMWAKIIETRFANSKIYNCRVYGASIWNIYAETSIQSNVIITQRNENIISVDNIEIAQFLHLIIVNKKIKDVIDAVSSKIILILGRFSPNRKVVLDRLKMELAKLNFVPVVFDFQKPNSKDYIEPVLLIAQLSRFVVVDFSEPKIVLEEVPIIARNTSTVIIPILQRGQVEPVTLSNLKINQRSISKTFFYKDIDHLISTQLQKIVNTGNTLFNKLSKRRNFNTNF